MREPATVKMGDESRSLRAMKSWSRGGMKPVIPGPHMMIRSPPPASAAISPTGTQGIESPVIGEGLVDPRGRDRHLVESPGQIAEDGRSLEALVRTHRRKVNEGADKSLQVRDPPLKGLEVLLPGESEHFTSP
jgi:hypothetical protein